MKKRVHYPPEIKWEAIKLRRNGASVREVMRELGIKNKSQVEIWWKWYQKGGTHRFSQPVGKQYSYGKGIHELPEIELLHLKVKQLEMHNELLGKSLGILRNCQKRESST